MLLLRTLLQMPELRLSLHTGEDQLDRTVTRVYGTELPDPSRYLSGGELVLSGLLWHHGPQDSETFVRSLAAARSPAWPPSETESEQLPDRPRRRLRPPPRAAAGGAGRPVVRDHHRARVDGARRPLRRHRRLLNVVAEGSGLPALLIAGGHELGRALLGAVHDRPGGRGRRTARARRAGEGVPAGRPPPEDGEGHDAACPSPNAAATGSPAGSSSWRRPGQHEAAAELASLVALERLRAGPGPADREPHRRARCADPPCSAGSRDLQSRLAAAGLEQRPAAGDQRGRRPTSAPTSPRPCWRKRSRRPSCTPVGDTVYAVAKADDSPARRRPRGDAGDGTGPRLVPRARRHQLTGHVAADSAAPRRKPRTRVGWESAAAAARAWSRARRSHCTNCCSRACRRSCARRCGAGCSARCWTTTPSTASDLVGTLEGVPRLFAARGPRPRRKLHVHVNTLRYRVGPRGGPARRRPGGVRGAGGPLPGVAGGVAWAGARTSADRTNRGRPSSRAPGSSASSAGALRRSSRSGPVRPMTRCSSRLARR